MTICAVPICTSKKGEAARKLGITFHEFPSNLELREKWIVAISRKDPDLNGYWVPKSWSLVCSLHFTSESFKCTPKRKVLFPGSIPSIFPGNPVYMQTGNSPAKCCRLVRVNKQIPPSSPNASETEAIICNNNLLFENVTELHEIPMLDINSKCTKNLSSISSTTAEMKNKQLKTVCMQTGNSPAKCCHPVRVHEQIPPSSHSATESELVSETEATICNEDLLHEDLPEVHQNRMLDINSKCMTSEPSIPSTNTETKCQQLKTIYMQDENSPSKVHIVRVNKQIPSSSLNATELKLVCESEATICNENLLLEDLVEVHQTLDINTKYAKSLSSISSTATEMKCEQLKIKCKQFKTRYDSECRKNRRLNAKMRKLEEELQTLRDNNKSLNYRMSQYNISYLEESIKSEDTKALFLKDQLLSLNKKKMLWSDCTIKNSVRLRSKSSAAYHFLRKMNILSLPSISSLLRHVNKCNKEVIDPLNDLSKNLPYVIEKRDIWFT